MKPVYIVDYVVRDTLGLDVRTNYESMAGAPGAQRITRYDPSEFPQVLSTNGFQLPDGYAENNSNIGFKMAIDMCDELARDREFPKDTAIVVGSFALAHAIKDDFQAAYNNHQRRFSPTKIFMANHDLLSSLIAGRLKLEGLSTSLNAACSSSMYNLYMAWLMIQNGDVGSAIVGNVDAPLWPSFQYYWQCTSAISTRNGGYSIPFHKERDGFLQGEGGTMWYVCDEETLVKYNLTPKAVIKSIAAGAKVYTIPAHDKTCQHQLLMIDRAFKQSGTRPEDIAFFNAHATSTAVGDDIEFDVFTRAFENVDLPIVSFKGYIGHTMSASGLLETSYGLEAVRNGYIQPNHGLTDPLSDDPRLITQKKDLSSRTFMKASFGFGGRTAIAIIDAL
jgi:3-oxoacyl-[acyl-carrier-protein] synthase II